MCQGGVKKLDHSLIEVRMKTVHHVTVQDHWCKADVRTIGYLHPNMATEEIGSYVYTR
jgi:hypothetical protein